MKKSFNLQFFCYKKVKKIDWIIFNQFKTYSKLWKPQKLSGKWQAADKKDKKPNIFISLNWQVKCIAERIKTVQAIEVQELIKVDRNWFKLFRTIS